MPALIDEIRQETKLAKAAAAQALEAKRIKEQEDAVLETIAMQQRALDVFPEVKGKIKEAAKEGKTKIWFSLASWRTEFTSADNKYADALTALLKAENFTVHSDTTSLEPVGSDPLFYHTVYNLYLVISWK